jgi:hypothetical protein
LPVVAFAEELGDDSHGVYLEYHTEGLFKGPLDFVAVEEVGEVVHVDAEVQGRFAVNGAAGEDARVVLVWGHANLNECGN